MTNRRLMMDTVIEAVKASGETPSFDAKLEVVNCHHNYVAMEHHYGQNVYVTRKGAVRARASDICRAPASTAH